MEIGDRLAAPTASERQTDAPTMDGLDRDAFMRLLVAQLQNQDPLDPMKAEQMTSQLAELTSVAQLTAIEGRLEAMEIGVAALSNAETTGLVGKNVRASIETLAWDGETPARGAFVLDAPADAVTVTVYGPDGRAVRTLEVTDPGPGAGSYSWDGRGDSGEELPPGRYRVEVTAEGPGGARVPVRQEASGLVTGVVFQGGVPVLQVGPDGLLVRLGDVESIELP